GLIDLCLTELGTFTGPDHEQEDDITLVSLQRSPSAWHQETWRPEELHPEALHPQALLPEAQQQDARQQDTRY
ncbi:MAG TPA: hypothetical protein VJ370_20020, partial [Streptosporangiaceae bacterium]|nr:hypothetical protein [Streptosporangiaceae bacterium]